MFSVNEASAKPSLYAKERIQSKGSKNSVKRAQETDFNSSEDSLSTEENRLASKKKGTSMSLPRLDANHTVLENGAIVGVDDDDLIQGQSLPEGPAKESTTAKHAPKQRKNLVLQYASKGDGTLVHSHSAPRIFNLARTGQPSSDNGSESKDLKKGSSSTIANEPGNVLCTCLQHN
jgi:hypothetical protein